MPKTPIAPPQELAAQIEKLHSPDVQSVDVRPYLCLVERVINEIVTDNVEGHAMGSPSSRDLEALAPLVTEIWCQITKGLIGRIDNDSIAKYVLKIVSHFSWEAKAVLTIYVGYSRPTEMPLLYACDQLDLVTGEMRELVDKKMEQKIKKVIYETVQMDNLPVLKLLICVEELYDCQAKRSVHLDVLRSRNVLLLISGLDITEEELHKFEQIYTERTHAYDIVWIPVIDPSTQWTDAMRAKFETMQASMPWYTICDPKAVRKAVVSFFRQDWYFQGKPIIAVRDPLGKVMNPNAIHMMWIWRGDAFPFTRAREEDLWQKQIWNLEFLVDADQRILEWIREGKYIILYGTNRLKWIRDFTTRAKEMAGNLQVPVEMVYVGKRHHKDMVQKLCAATAAEQLSHCWLDPNQLWYFWTRLESMFHSKMQVGRICDQNDITLQELQRLRSFYKGHEGWTVLAKGSNIIVSAHGRLALTVLKEYDKWEQRARKEGFEVAFAAHYSELYKEEYICSSFVFPITAKTPDHMPCPECHREMLKFKTFRCCHENATPGSSAADN